MKKEELQISGSGDVFIDLGFSEEEAAELNIHTYLTWAIRDAVKTNGSRQAVIAKKLGIDQPKVSKIRNGNTDEFSIGRLAGFLLNMGYDIHIGITPPNVDTDSRGKIRLIDPKKRRKPTKKHHATA
ncbi:MAG: helix-turn-helix domain-containing protein [Candidatus Obscuribacterales bacterium]|nr:helix-turn-helix domain-containing protein [Candidatus Obscuribacterales bacterium]